MIVLPHLNIKTYKQCLLGQIGRVQQSSCQIYIIKTAINTFINNNASKNSLGYSLYNDVHISTYIYTHIQTYVKQINFLRKKSCGNYLKNIIRSKEQPKMTSFCKPYIAKQQKHQKYDAIYRISIPFQNQNIACFKIQLTQRVIIQNKHIMKSTINICKATTINIRKAITQLTIISQSSSNSFIITLNSTSIIPPYPKKK
eukprot:TRINITY_DN1090_c0_g1_i10.p1 TRINITY_DN1090_c0_g1~~TRINITY_DN1090_c0_g1_i10.p1  ORF type:complete len:200 (+),score=-25.65 TRINITY_DN1090_c0_g1_i10:337-936(+)